MDETSEQDMDDDIMSDNPMRQLEMPHFFFQHSLVQCRGFLGKNGANTYHEDHGHLAA